MSKLLIACSLLFLISLNNISYAQEANYFDGNNQYVFDSVLYAASVEKKPVFIFIHSIYCGVCSELETKTLGDTALVGILNRNYYSIKTDLESEAGVKQVNLLGVENIPTLIILNWKGQQLRKITGLMESRDLSRMLSVIAKRTHKYLELSAQCKDGNCDKGERAQQIILLAYLQLKNEGLSLALNYFKTYGYNELFEDEWEIMTEYFYEPVDSPLLYFLDHVNRFREIYGDKSVDGYLQELFEYNFSTAVQNKSTERLAFAISILKHFKSSGEQPLLMKRMQDYYTLRYYNQTGDWKAYTVKAFDYFKKYEGEEDEARKILMNIYLHSEKLNDIKKAKSVARKLMKNNPCFENKIALAFMEQRLGNYSSAYRLLEEADKIAGSQDELNTVKKIRSEFKKEEN